MRSLFCTLFVFALCAVAFAKDYEGAITKVDGDTITVKIGDDEKAFVVTEETKFGGGKAKVTKESLVTRLEKSKTKTVPVRFSTEEKDGAEVLQGGKPVITKLAVGGKKKAAQ